MGPGAPPSNEPQRWVSHPCAFFERKGRRAQIPKRRLPVQNSYAMPEGLVRYRNALRIPDGKFIQTGPPLRRSEIGKEKSFALSYFCMAFPIKTCVICSQEFELHPNKPGFATHLFAASSSCCPRSASSPTSASAAPASEAWPPRFPGKGRTNVPLRPAEELPA